MFVTGQLRQLVRRGSGQRVRAMRGPMTGSAEIRRGRITKVADYAIANPPRSVCCALFYYALA
jgi:hypothetical protein